MYHRLFCCSAGSLSGKEKELPLDEIIETSLPADIGTWIEDKKANLSDT